MKDDEDLFFMANMADIYETKRAREELNKANKKLNKIGNEFLRNVSKESKTEVQQPSVFSFGVTRDPEAEEERIQDEVEERVREMFEDELEWRIQEKIQELKDDWENEEWWHDEEEYLKIHARGVDMDEYENMEDYERYATLKKIGLDPADYKTDFDEFDYVDKNWKALRRLEHEGVDMDNFMFLSDREIYEEIDSYDLDPKDYRGLFEDPGYPEEYVRLYEAEEEDFDEDEEDEPDWDLEGTDEALVDELKKCGLDLAAFLKLNDFEKYKLLSDTWMEPESYERFFDDVWWMSDMYEDLLDLEEKGFVIAEFLGLSDDEKYDLIAARDLDPEKYFYVFEFGDCLEERKKGE